MNRYGKFIIALSIMVFVGSAFYPGYGQTAPKREFRGAWIHIVGDKTLAGLGTEGTQELFTGWLDSLQAVHCNAVIFQVRPTADAFYDSPIEPWSRYLTGVQGKCPDPYWDPLEFVIEESHRRGMEVHAWCNPYRVTLEEGDSLCADHLFYSSPELFVRYGKQWYLNPAEPAARSHTVRVIADLVRRYDIEAVHFDDYFYPYPIAGLEFDDEKSFARYGAGQGFGKERKADWRRYNVELLIRELNDTIKSIKPWVRFGISPFGIHRNKKDTPDGSGSDTNGLSNYDQLYADVPRWMRKGYIDYCVPQLYWKIGHPKADYEVLIRWWNRFLERGHLYIGQSISTFGEKDPKNPKLTQTARKIALTRQLHRVAGNVWWPGKAVASDMCGIFRDLKDKYQRYPALIPAYRELDAVPPAPAADVHKNGRLIEWHQDPAEAADPMQHALFYGVYCFPKGVSVDVGRAEYLLKLTRDCSYNVITENKNHGAGCKYVITVIDRCWNESRPSAVLWY